MTRARSLETAARMAVNIAAAGLIAGFSAGLGFAIGYHLLSVLWTN